MLPLQFPSLPSFLLSSALNASEESISRVLTRLSALFEEFREHLDKLVRNSRLSQRCDSCHGVGCQVKKVELDLKAQSDELRAAVARRGVLIKQYIESREAKKDSAQSVLQVG